jgi:hypothetical protein
MHTGMPLDKKNLAAQKAAMGLKSPPGKAGMTRMDSVSKMGTDGMGRAAYAAGRLVTPGGPWTQQVRLRQWDCWDATRVLKLGSMRCRELHSSRLYR